MALAAALDGRGEIARLPQEEALSKWCTANASGERQCVLSRTAALLVGLDADIALRNQHTHDEFLSLGIWTDIDIYDPADALLDLSTRPSGQQVLRDFLSEEIQRMIDEQNGNKGRTGEFLVHV